MNILGPASAARSTVLANLGTVAPVFRDQMFPALWDVAVAYGDIFGEMVALSQELGFKVRVWGKRSATTESEAT